MMKTRSVSRALPLLCVFCAVALSGCLKSRLQVREDGGEPRPVPGKIQEVQPQASYVVDELKGELTRLTGRVEDLERARQDASASAPQKEDLRKLETRVQELETAQAQLIDTIKKLTEQKPAAPAAADGHESFEKAKAQFDAGNYDAAIDAFSSYLKVAKGSKAEEATFLRAESYFITKQYKKAIVDYSRFPEKYSKSRHLPVALLKIGHAFEALGLKDDAKGFYQELVDKYPKSSEAKKARAKLK
ncbi:MAG: tetratricopeptide repeat protein [Oligoflexia bacterium]|nr:tetratricopeptide repeat protein [Oligoflexia bacterium]